MATTQEAAGNITRWADPQGDSFGVHADVSYSFWGGAGAFTGDQQTTAEEVMRLWEDVAQINFFVDSADPEIGYKNFPSTPEDTPLAAGYATDTGPGNFNPDTTHQVGFDLSFTGPLGSGRLNIANPGDQATQLGQGQVGRAVLIHEIGHAIGLEHPDHAGNSRQYSSMSGNAETATGADFSAPGLPPEWWRTPLLHDIAAAQHFYGANMTTRTGDNVYGFNSNAGRAYDIQITPSGSPEKAVFTIYDAGGNDTLDLSGYGIKNRWDGSNWVAYEQVINLNPNTFSNTGGLMQNMSMADAVNVNGNNSWEAGFDPNRIANYIENAIGGSERDIIYGNATGNTLRGENGNDELWGGDGLDRLFGGAGVDDLHGGDGEDVLWGGSEDDRLFGESDGSKDSMFGGTGNDVYEVTERLDTVTEDAGDANGTADKVYTTLGSYDMRDPAKGGNVEILQFTGEGNFTGHGNGLNNILIGAAGVDRLYGYAGHDTLDGGYDGRFDVLRGGAHDDTYIVHEKENVIEGFDSGIDEVRTDMSRYWLDPNVENLTYIGAGGPFEGHGNALNNIIHGSRGADKLYGYDGNDRLIGGASADRMGGGEGDDTYVVSDAGDKVIETKGRMYDDGLVIKWTGGTDTVETTLSEYSLASLAYVENLSFTGTGPFTGFGNGSANRLLGGAFDDKLYGLGGNDTLAGGEGINTLEGGAGDDVYIVDSRWDETIEEGFYLDRNGNIHDAGNDTVVTSLREHQLQANVENLLFANGDDHIGRGNSGHNTITGSSGHDMLAGLAGDDTLTGNNGSDWFVFGDGWGHDTVTDFQQWHEFTELRLGVDKLDMRGVTGLKSFDQLTITSEAEGTRIAFAGNSILLQGVASVTASDFLFKKLNGIVGTGDADPLHGTGDADHIEALGGDDLLVGYKLGDILDGGDGDDTASYADSDAAITIDLGKGIGLGGDAEGDSFVSIERFIGSAFDDTFQGGSDRGNFLAGDGNDSMIGGSSYDWLEGGAGNDSFVGTGGFMVMFGGDGDDVMTGSLDSGNYFDGGAGNDVMIGGNTGDYMADVTGGDDTMRGGGGDDTMVDMFGATELYGEAGKDFVTSAGGSGLLDGGADNDYLSVANGTYTLFGGEGDDTLEFAGYGSASFTGGAGADVFTYRVTSGTMTVTDFADGIDHIYLWDNHYNSNVPLESLTIADSAEGAVISWHGMSQMVLTGIHASQLTPDDFLISLDSITGTDSADRLVGDGTANHIVGLGGDDVLIGNGGPDILDGGTGTDTADYSGSQSGISINLANGTGHGGDADGDTLISIEDAIGSAFDDTFQGGAAVGQFIAGDGNDTMIGGAVYDSLEGGAGNDTFTGTGGFMVMNGGDGDDRMTGSLNNTNYFDGGRGSDVMIGGNYADQMHDADGGDNTVHGGGGHNVMYGGGGNDHLVDLHGNSELFGEVGNDTIYAGDGSGLLDGGDGDDNLRAHTGSYTLVGGAGNDTFEFMGEGNASFTGGEGSDVFTYKFGTGPVTVTDFEDGIDHIFLWDNHNYGHLPLESLSIADSAEGAIVSFNGVSTMTLTGITASQLTLQDFVI